MTNVGKNPPPPPPPAPPSTKKNALIHFNPVARVFVLTNCAKGTTL